jgi:hypothetical protein
MAARPDSPPETAAELGGVANSGATTVLEFLGLLDNVDCVVNANVLLYLGERAETERTVDYIIRAVVEGQDATCSRLYLDRLAFYHAVSRAYASGASSLARTRELIVEQVVATRAENGSWGNELLTALAGCTLLNFGLHEPSLTRGVEYLLETQREDGSWRRIAMFPGPEPYYGSEELTTALCVELLARYG